MRPNSIQMALLALALFVTPALVRGEPTISEAMKALPDNLDSFKAEGPATSPADSSWVQIAGTGEFGPVAKAVRPYRDASGNMLGAEFYSAQSEGAAFALFTRLSHDVEMQPRVIGAASTVTSYRIAFCKGNSVVAVFWSHPSGTQDQLFSFARALSATLPSGDGQVPVLVMHLPDWETKIGHLSYAVTSLGLKSAGLNQPILDAVSFEGGTEAVVANYGQSQLVIVEFTTPQFSIENDQRIWTKISELKSQNQPTPIAYRRVGNYSVFVFNAPDEKTANALVDQVRYEQVVQWLGDDPHMADRLTRYFRRTTSGVLVAVLKSSGLSLILCAGIGALFGAMLFRHRRARQAAFYSDAGGSTRLNLDELTDANKSQRLLTAGEQPEADS